MFCINKIVGWVLSPLGLLFLGCLLGAALRLWRLGALRRVGASVFAGSLAVFWVLSCGITTRILGVPLEGEEAPLVDTLEVGGCDAIVLLGGGMGFTKHADEPKCSLPPIVSGRRRVNGKRIRTAI